MPPKKPPKSRRRKKSPKQSQSRSAPPRKTDGKTFEVSLIDISNEGVPFGILMQRPVFIPYTIPGEQVTARIVRKEKDRDHGRGVKLLEASADRVFAPCEHFGAGKCRNCHWQHIDYPAQLLLKQDMVAETLSRHGEFSDEVLEAAMQPVIASPEQWGFLHQVWLYRLDDGGFGYFLEGGKGGFVPLECPVIHPDLFALYQSLEMDLKDVKRLQLLVDSEGALMIILDMRAEKAPELNANFAASVNLILPDKEPMNLVGNTMMHYRVNDRRFRVTAGAYFRPNVGQMPALIAKMLELLDLQGDENVLDLYAGVGVLSAFIAPHADLVTMVESYPPAATDAESNLEDAENVDIVEGSVEEVLASMLEEDAYYDTVILDPPSSGLSKDAREALIKMAPVRLLYISSSATTLGRDAQALCEAGYALRHVQPFDFSPQMVYIETMALFEKV